MQTLCAHLLTTGAFSPQLVKRRGSQTFWPPLRLFIGLPGPLVGTPPRGAKIVPSAIKNNHFFLLGVSRFIFPVSPVPCPASPSAWLLLRLPVLKGLKPYRVLTGRPRQWPLQQLAYIPVTAVVCSSQQYEKLQTNVVKSSIHIKHK